MQLSRRPLNVVPLFLKAQCRLQRHELSCSYTSTISMETVDLFTTELLHRRKRRLQNQTNTFTINDLCVRCFMKTKQTKEPIILSNLTPEQLESTLVEFQAKNKDSDAKQVLAKCIENKRYISEHVLKVLLRSYCMAGNVNMVTVLQSYCKKTTPGVYLRNGEFLHYLAKAQCMKGNSDKGLLILKDCYTTYEHLRSLYRVIFKELIHDSVSNRSEASMVIFKNNVLEFSERWGDHYPMVCLWHICWTSSWFSDQMLSNELLDSSQTLRNIVKNKSTAFSLTVLRRDGDEDAVVRLLQFLLKYNQMREYCKVLQVLFGHKVKNRDLRGCTEIIRNCEVLGISLPSDQQGRYIQMLIDGKPPPPSDSKPPAKSLKFKF